MREKITIQNLVKNLKLKVLYGEEFLDRIITRHMTSRPGVEIYSDYFEFYESTRIQVIGTKELNLFYMISNEDKKIRVNKLFAYNPPAFIFTGNVSEIPQEFFDASKEYKIPILKTKLRTTAFIGQVNQYLSVELAEKKTVHGVMLDIDGVGVLLKGKSFVGKSETALELIKRGHALISDDSVELVRQEDGGILTSSPKLTERLMEIRGIGIIDVVDLFGLKAFRSTKQLRMVVELVRYEEGMKIDRLGLDEETELIFDIEVPKVKIYVMPGRNLATLVEVAAMNWRLKTFGRNAAKEFVEKLDKALNKKD
jgi:HPr kinase/phosphorylase